MLIALLDEHSWLPFDAGSLLARDVDQAIPLDHLVCRTLDDHPAVLDQPDVVGEALEVRDRVR